MRASPLTARTAGHFGELIQGRIGENGPVALVTLPCPDLCVTAQFQPDRHLRLFSQQRLITPAQARTFLTGLNGAFGRFRLHAQMPAGGGAGASTAALVALAQLACRGATAKEIAQACIATEGASDPLMLPRPERVLWASRRAQVLAQLPPLPRFDVVGGFFGPPRRTRSVDHNFADVSDLVARWQSVPDLETLAQVASLSAQRNLALRGPAQDPTENLAKRLGAVGHVIAHTGSARGLIFAPGTVPPSAKSALRQSGFRQVFQFRAGSIR